MEVAQEWPEPIVRVQSLADAEAIPERYIKPPSERPNLNPGTAMAAGETVCLPVVDLGGLRGGAAERQATMRAVSDACREWGFFQAVNHGVSPALTAAVREAWRQFFHLPMAEKQAYANSPTTFEGYGSRLGVKKGAILDWGDYFFLQLLPQSIKNYDKWPTLPASLRETTEAYGEELVKLCGVIKEVLSLTLGMDEGFLHRGFGEPGACLRVNFYPKCPQPELTLGLSPHSDPGGMTVLLTDEHVKGLQVRKGDDWITVQPIPDALIVNIGDQIQVKLFLKEKNRESRSSMMQVLTNATYKSVEHRVMVNPTAERLSLAFFYNPDDDLPVEPAAELVTPTSPPAYKAMTFKEYKLYMRMVGPSGKSHVDLLKAA
ncbi:2OG-Fe(II) oxygenase superfamily [Musa troglodytarum]|uniref:2OG-Fe(II) oxygenase superfamily n=1 Tax=Musa troglodytarum TaxID=320322 RepID=A0A9E7H2M2_9LILI|nr:2OG-Fe(II) oxygenase superfamily [Musa troglodytarum]